MNLIKAYGVTLVTFLLIDFVWLGFIAKKFYAKHLGYLMAPKPNWAAAFIFYLIFVAGLLLFVIYPQLNKEGFLQVLLYGMAFGLVTYATYDLTNLATIKDWPVLITVVDLIWGTSLSGITSLISLMILRKIL